MEHTGFPSEETLAAFIDGRLDAETRQRVVEHLAQCSECYETFVGVGAWGREARSETFRSTPSRRQWVAGTAATIAAAIAAVVLVTPIRDRLIDYRDAHRTGLSNLTAVANSLHSRPIEARLSGGFEYHPYEVRRGPGPSDNRLAEYRLKNAALDVAIRAEKRSTPAELHAVGIAELVIYEFDDAVRDLEACLQMDTHKADIATAIHASANVPALIDLSAALYSRGVKTRNRTDLGLAYEAASRAATLSPKSPQAHFQKALTLERLDMIREARAEWTLYLTIDGASEWSREVRNRIADLESPNAAAPPDADRLLSLSANDGLLAAAVAGDVQNARTIAEEVFLPRWGGAVLKGRSGEAARYLVAARRVGELIASIDEDHTVEECVAAAATADDDAVARIAEAYAAFGHARALYYVATDALALDATIDAARRLGRINSTLAPRAFAFAATISNYLGRNDDALTFVARALKSDFTGRPVAESQLHWAAGTVHYATGRPETALRSLFTALDRMRRTHETANIIGIETMIATVYRYMGDTDAAWSHTMAAVDDSVRGPATYERRQNAIDSAARQALKSGCHDLAAAFAREILSNAQSVRDRVHAANALTLLGVAATAAGDVDAAEAAFRESEHCLSQMPPSGTKTRMEADRAVAYADALSGNRPSDAIAFLRSAIPLVASLGVRNRLPHLYLVLGDAHRARGNAVDALAAYRDGIVEIKAQRALLATDAERSAFTDTGRALFDRAIASTYAREPAAALALVLDAYRIGLTSGTHLDAEVSGVATATTNETRIIYYMLSDSLLIWRIDAHGADLRRTAIDATFRARVARDVEAVRDPDTVLSIDAASHLYSMLIAPIGRGLPLRATLVIAADGFLNEVPFAGLFDSEQHRFLVESHPIAIASSTSSQAPSEQSYGSVAVIAAPTSPLSDDLAHAGQEADAIGGAIPAKIIRGVDATAERLLSCLGRYAAVHYSGHSESMARGDSGRLLLTPDAHHADGALYGAEVRMKRADGTGLVVLNSCSGGSGKVSSARVGSMARDFIEAGVPRVLAGLWRVDDAAAAHFSSIFYRSLARGETAESALRAAQLSLARTERFRSPRFWAGYNLFRSERL